MLQKVTRLDSVPTAEETVLTTEEPALHPTLYMGSMWSMQLATRRLLCSPAYSKLWKRNEPQKDKSWPAHGAYTHCKCSEDCK